MLIVLFVENVYEKIDVFSSTSFLIFNYLNLTIPTLMFVFVKEFESLLYLKTCSHSCQSISLLMITGLERYIKNFFIFIFVGICWVAAMLQILFKFYFRETFLNSVFFSITSVFFYSLYSLRTALMPLSRGPLM